MSHIFAVSTSNSQLGKSTGCDDGDSDIKVNVDSVVKVIELSQLQWLLLLWKAGHAKKTDGQIGIARGNL